MWTRRNWLCGLAKVGRTGEAEVNRLRKEKQRMEGEKKKKETEERSRKREK